MWVRFPLRPHFLWRKFVNGFFRIFLLLASEANSIIHSNCSTMNSQKYIVVYRRSLDGPEFREWTSNLSYTIAMLEAQGFTIIDIIDIG